MSNSGSSGGKGSNPFSGSPYQGPDTGNSYEGDERVIAFNVNPQVTPVFASNGTLGFSDLNKKIYKKIDDGATTNWVEILDATSSGGAPTPVAEPRIITASEALNKKLTLLQIPTIPTSVEVSVEGGSDGIYGLDYIITGGNVVDWTGLGFAATPIEAGDQLIFYYEVI